MTSHLPRPADPRGEIHLGSIELSRPWAIRNVGSSCLVEVDGRLGGRLPSGKHLVLEVAPGEHVLQVRIDTTGYPKLGFMGSAKHRLALGAEDTSNLLVVPISRAPFLQKNDPEGWFLIQDTNAVSHTKVGESIKFDRRAIIASVLLLTLFVFMGIAYFDTAVGTTSWYVYNVIASVSAAAFIYLRFVRN